MTIERAEYERFADQTTQTLLRIENTVNLIHRSDSDAHSTLALHGSRIEKLERPDVENKPVTRGQLRIVVASGAALIAVLKFLKVL